MDIKRYILLLLVGITTCILLLGCTVPIHSYIRNTSTKAQSVFITFLKSPNDSILFYAGDLEQEPRFDRVDELDKKITALKMNNDTYEIIIPPKTTVFMEKSLNFRSLIYKSISVKSIELINNEGLYSQVFKTKREGLSKQVIWFDIE